MRYIPLVEFLKLPSGTFYSKCDDPQICDPTSEILIKRETISDSDWIIQGITGVREGPDFNNTIYADIYMEMMENNKSVPLDISTERDGEYERSAWFLIYEKSDLLQLQKYINDALEVCV